MSTSQLSFLKTRSTFFPQSHSNTSRTKDSPLHSARQSPKAQASSAYPSPRQSSSGFIYLDRKKTRTFIMTDKLLQHTQIPKKSPTSTGIRLSRLEATPRTATPSAVLGSPENILERKSSVKDVVSPTSGKNSRNASSLMKKDVIDELQSAKEVQDRIAKLMSPLAHKKSMLEENEGGDKLTQLLKHHNHRLYGIDHLNLKKLNTLINSKETVKDQVKKKFSTLKVDTKNLNPLAINRLDMKQAAKIQLEEEHVFKNSNAYEYNPVIDGFQFTGPNLQELDQVIASLTNSKDPITPRQKQTLSPPNRRSKLKSQTTSPWMDSPRLLIPLDEKSPRTPFHPLSARSPGSGRLTRGSGFDFGKAIEIGGISERAIKKENKKGVPNLKISAEETIEEQSQRIIAYTYRHHNERGSSRINFGPTEDKMKKIGDLCGKLEIQSKKMMRKVNRSNVKLDKEFKKLGRRVTSLLESRFKEVVVPSDLQQTKKDLVRYFTVKEFE